MNCELVQKFHNAFINADQKLLEKLWAEETPTSLIKFYSGTYEANGNNYFLNSLSNNTLWLSSPAFFNDPFDCVINFDSLKELQSICNQVLNALAGENIANQILASKEAKEQIDAAINDMALTLVDSHSRFEKSVYVACFSEIDNLTSLRMWAHYANSHSGVCAQYNFDTVKNATPFTCIPIKYTDDYHYLLNANTTSESVANFMKFYTKAKEWEYEKEWRVARTVEKPAGKGFTVSIDWPEAIYLGCKISDKLKDDVISTCKGTGIKIYQMKMKPGSFKMDCEKIR